MHHAAILTPSGTSRPSLDPLEHTMGRRSVPPEEAVLALPPQVAADMGAATRVQGALMLETVPYVVLSLDGPVNLVRLGAAVDRMLARTGHPVPRAEQFLAAQGVTVPQDLAELVPSTATLTLADVLGEQEAQPGQDDDEDEGVVEPTAGDDEDGEDEDERESAEPAAPQPVQQETELQPLPAPDGDPAPEDAAALALFTGPDIELTAALVAAALGIHRQKATVQLTRLVGERRLRRAGAGRYALPQAAGEA